MKPRQYPYQEWIEGEAKEGTPDFPVGVGYVILDEQPQPSSPGLGPASRSKPCFLLDGKIEVIHPLRGINESGPDGVWRDAGTAGTRMVQKYRRRLIEYDRMVHETAPLRRAAREIHDHARVIYSGHSVRKALPEWWDWSKAVKFHSQEQRGWVTLHPAPEIADVMPEDERKYWVCRFAYAKHISRRGKENPADIDHVLPVPFEKFGPILGAENALRLAEKLQAMEMGEFHWGINEAEGSERFHLHDDGNDQYLRRYWFKTDNWGNYLAQSLLSEHRITVFGE
jgi:hypothetical protein